MEEVIQIKGAKTNNLKNITVDIPRNKLVVITGLSGSGKSSLAFDTLYAEGQRRYVESLSAYARQFLGRMQKPLVDFIDGIPPAIAIQQKVASKNPRSTVGTSTEIYDYLKLLYARIGHTISPVSGAEVKRHQVQDVVSYAMSLPLGTKLILLAPVSIPEHRTLIEQTAFWREQGFTRLFHNGNIISFDTLPIYFEQHKEEDNGSQENYCILIDRIVVDGEQSTANRFADSVQTAFYEGNGNCKIYTTDGHIHNFSIKFEADGITFIEPTEHLFDFNNPLGACPECNGFGNVIGIDQDLVVPDKSKTLYQGAIACWETNSMSEWKKALIQNAAQYDIPIHCPFFKLTPEQKQLIWTGTEHFKGLNDFFKFLDKQQYNKIQYRVLLARYKGKTLCTQCNGTRLRKETEYVYVDDKNIRQLNNMPISELTQWFKELVLTDNEQNIAKQLLIEIKSRLQFMVDVGLDYLTLNRMSSTLSGGETQRINLAKSLGSSLVGSLYVLDEPSIGLHPRDTHRLIKVLKELRDLGNTVVVVEHDEDIMRAADYIIDIGPQAGMNGGQVVWQGNITDIENNTQNNTHSYTIDFLIGKEKIEIPQLRRRWNNYIKVEGASENNLKNIDVIFPLNVMTVVTGVSGSGKSTLVNRVLYPALKKFYGGMAEHTGSHKSISGDTSLAIGIELVDQNPIGTSTRSNPVTYIKAYEEIRRLFAELQLSKQMGFTNASFSFNTPGGRCEECKGEGTVEVEMQFMANLVLECEHCHGKRFKSDILDIEFNGKNIYDILQMTVNQAIEFFTSCSNTAEPTSPKQRQAEPILNKICRAIVQRLKPLQDVGIGYIKLGQPSSTLSGGENQRVKLASFLADRRSRPTIYIFDEPTTGLHFHDIKILLKALNDLISNGHTVIIIEHNPAVILAADHIIDLGPDGGDKGGNIVFTGTPEDIIKCKESYTGQFLANELNYKASSIHNSN